jgi:hypothetical protein
VNSEAQECTPFRDSQGYERGHVVPVIWPTSDMGAHRHAGAHKVALEMPAAQSPCSCFVVSPPRGRGSLVAIFIGAIWPSRSKECHAELGMTPDLPATHTAAPPGDLILTQLPSRMPRLQMVVDRSGTHRAHKLDATLEHEHSKFAPMAFRPIVVTTSTPSKASGG